jgi:serine/threonine protein kinase
MQYDLPPELPTHLVGKGAFGRVLRDSCHKYAYKIMPDNTHFDMALTETEIGMLLSKKCPSGVVRTYGLAIVGDEVYIKLRYIAGGDGYDFMRRLKQPGTDKPAKIKAALHGMLGTLDNAHKTFGFCHNDIKQPNLLFIGDAPMLADFGVSYMSHLRDDFDNYAGSVNSTPPEALVSLLMTDKIEDVGNRRDRWACGIVALEWITGSMLNFGYGTAKPQHVLFAADAVQIWPDEFMLVRFPALSRAEITFVRTVLKYMERNGAMSIIDTRRTLPWRHYIACIVSLGRYYNMLKLASIQQAHAHTGLLADTGVVNALAEMERDNNTFNVALRNALPEYGDLLNDLLCY